MSENTFKTFREALEILPKTIKIEITEQDITVVVDSVDLDSTKKEILELRRGREKVIKFSMRIEDEKGVNCLSGRSINSYMKSKDFKKDPIKFYGIMFENILKELERTQHKDLRTFWIDDETMNIILKRGN